MKNCRVTRSFIELWYLALTLLVSEIVANDHHATITTNDFALVANLLHARFNLHDQTPFFLLTSFLQLVLLVPVNDSTSCEVVWTQFYDHTIFRQDADVVLSHLPADVGENFVSIGELDAEHRIR